MAKVNLNNAIAYDVGANPGQSDWAFNNWSTDLNDVIAINENAFTAAIQDGHSTGAPWDAAIPAVAVLLIAGLAIAGVWRRVSEYR
jgi:hypothetical protein